MASGRYVYSSTIMNGKGISSANTYRIFKAVDQGLIAYNTVVLEQAQRLDHMAGAAYGDASLWWVISAASGIGWCLQAPPGTIIRIPTDPNSAIGLIA